MLGYKVGDTFEWDTPGGIRIIRVKEILYQSEGPQVQPRGIILST
jgi:hypothetical protein